jgi:C-terminal processing protease CtpA/Prc
VLTSEATFAAGELVRVAFQGRPNTRSFGAPTGGRPVLQLHTTLSDGGHISLAAAYAFDRTGQVYDRPIPPDETVEMDWPAFGTRQDRVLATGLDWLRAQPGCDG